MSKAKLLDVTPYIESVLRRHLASGPTTTLAVAREVFGSPRERGEVLAVVRALHDDGAVQERLVDIAFGSSRAPCYSRTIVVRGDLRAPPRCHCKACFRGSQRLAAAESWATDWAEWYRNRRPLGDSPTLQQASWDVAMNVQAAAWWCIARNAHGATTVYGARAATEAAEATGRLARMQFLAERGVEVSRRDQRQAIEVLADTECTSAEAWRAWQAFSMRGKAAAWFQRRAA